MNASTPEARAAIKARREAGESYAAIAATYGVSRQRIQQLCAQLGVTSPVDLRRTSEALLDQAVALIREGAAPRAAAKTIGIGTRALHTRLQELGLDRESTRPNIYDGRRFELWSVVAGSYRYAAEKPNHRSVECRCECGTIRRVRISNLLSGASRGCGCRSKTGSAITRVRVPWICRQTEEQMPNTAALAKHAGVSPLVVYRRLRRGTDFIDNQGNTWTAQPEQAVEHKTTRKEAA
jgi:hypothetical protein